MPNGLRTRRRSLVIDDNGISNVNRDCPVALEELGKGVSLKTVLPRGIPLGETRNASAY